MTRAGYDFWLFDLDGTLVDIEPWYPKAVIGRVGDELGVDFSDHEAEVLWYGIGESREEYLARRSVAPERFWRTFHEVENPRERAKATSLYDDAEAFVTGIDGPVGLVTHCQRYLTDPVLDELGIRDWFDGVVCCSDATGWKPDPEPVHRLMRQLDVDADDDRGVLIGDDPADVGAARAAGLDPIRVVRRAAAESGEAVDHPVAGADNAAVDGADAAATDGGQPADDAATGEQRWDGPRRIASFAELS